MLISVIIPIYNIAPYLRNCLDSCLNQTFKNIEFICVDDGSTDESGQIADIYAAQDNRFVVIHKRNAGLPSARKAGIDIAKGDYIFHLDGDDDIPENAIENLVNVASKTNADIVIGSHFLYNDNGDKALCDSRIHINLYDDEYLNFILTEGLFNIWGKLIKRDLYTSNDIDIPLGISICEDLIQTTQLAYYSRVCVPCNEVVYNYYIRSTSMSKTNDKTVGQLTDRAIYAVCFVTNFLSQRVNINTRNLLSNYIKSFVYLYLQSPYPVSIRKKELKSLTRFIKETDNGIKSFRDLVCHIAFHNLSLAKLIVKIRQIKSL